MSPPARSTLAVASIATLLTLVMAAPVLRSPTTRIFGDEIVGRQADAYTVISQLAAPRPLGPLTQPVTDYVGAALAHLSGSPVLALNLLVLVTFPLTAICTWLVARHLGLAAPGAALASLAVAFSPFHVAHAAYHPHIAQTQWLPLYVLALFRCIDCWSWRRATALLTATGLLVLSNFYFGFFAAVLTPAIALSYWRWGGPGPGRRPARDLVLTALTLIGVVGAGLLYLVRFAPAALTRPDGFAFPRIDLFRYCARWWSYLMPPVHHPLAGGWVAAIWDRHGIADGLVEQQVYLGIGLLALAGAATLSWTHGDRDHSPLRAVPMWVVIAVLALVCSLSPERQYGALLVPRPSAALYALAPMFRAYARFGALVGLAVALLAGIGFDRLLGAGRRRLAGLLVLAVGIELAPFPPWRSHDVLPTAAHRALAPLPVGTVSLLDCATDRETASRPPAAIFPHPIRQLAGEVADCGEPGLGGKLAALGITHVINRPGVLAGFRLDPAAPPAGLRLVARFADSDLLAVVAAPDPIFVRNLVGFSWREFQTASAPSDRTYRWMGDAGKIQVVNCTGGAITATLEIELAAFAVDRELLITHPGGETRITVTPTPSRFRIGPLPLAPGLTSIALHAIAEPLSSQALTGAGDDRPVSVAVWQWRWTIEEREPSVD